MNPFTSLVNLIFFFSLLLILAPGSLAHSYDSPEDTEIKEMILSTACIAESVDDVTLMSCSRCIRGNMRTWYWDPQSEPMDDPPLCETCIR